MITLRHTPSVEFSEVLRSILATDIPAMPIPAFASTPVDTAALRTQIAPFLKYDHILLIGNGGSRTSAYALYHALAAFRDHHTIHFLSSAEPELVQNLQQTLSPENTLVLAISKSGDNINVLEPLLSFMEYPVLVITQDQPSTLRELATRKHWALIDHPNVGGRFSGMTSCGLVPAALAGLDIDAISAGAREGYTRFAPTTPIEHNEALRLAAILAQLEETGSTEIFASIYSSSLFAFLPLIIQLLHESSGKDGRGQTIFGDIAPESQHHTNQRFFGGRRNVVGLFMSLENHTPDTTLTVPDDVADVPFRGETLGILNGLSGSATLAFDKAGVLGHCQHSGIPAFDLTVSETSPKSMGYFMAFWHSVATYAAMLRRQNPFDQPEVEQSKQISFELRKHRV